MARPSFPCPPFMASHCLLILPFRQRRDGGPELVIRRKHPVVAMPVLPRQGLAPFVSANCACPFCPFFCPFCLRRPLQEGQTPRPLHKKATPKPCPHEAQRALPHPKQRMRQVRYDRRSQSNVRRNGMLGDRPILEPAFEVVCDSPCGASSQVGVARSGGNLSCRSVGGLWTASATQPGRRSAVRPCLRKCHWPASVFAGLQGKAAAWG